MSGVPVVPVLVGGTPTASADELSKPRRARATLRTDERPGGVRMVGVELATAVVSKLVAPYAKGVFEKFSEEARTKAMRVVTKIRDKVRDILRENGEDTKILEDVEDGKADRETLEEILRAILERDKAAADELRQMVDSHSEIVSSVRIDASVNLEHSRARDVTGATVNYGNGRTEKPS